MKKVAVIGYGNIAKKHIDVFRNLGVEVVASSNRSLEKNTLAREEAGIPKTYVDFHQMILSERLDGLIVCVSFWEMYNVLKEVIPYGIPILAEKPTSTSYREHLSLVELARKHNTLVMVGLNRRHYSVLSKAINLAGGKSEITSVMVEWSENPRHLIAKRGLNAEQIGKYIFGNSIHGIDLMLWLAGELEDSSLFTANFGDPFQWIMNFSGKSKTQVLCNFNSSWKNHVPWRVVFTSLDKRFVMAPLEKCFFTSGSNTEYSEILPNKEDIDFKAGFCAQARVFISQEIEEFEINSITSAMLIADTITNRFIR